MRRSSLVALVALILTTNVGLYYVMTHLIPMPTAQAAGVEDMVCPWCDSVNIHCHYPEYCRTIDEEAEYQAELRACTPMSTPVVPWERPTRTWCDDCRGRPSMHCVHG